MALSPKVENVGIVFTKKVRASLVPRKHGGWRKKPSAGSDPEIPVSHRPPRGFLEDLELTLPFSSVSKRHAVLHVAEDGLYLRDLSSTNGTFVNRKRVSEALLEEGDILHFAEVEFRIGRRALGATQRNSDEGTLTLRRLDLPHQFISGTRELNRLLDEEMVTAAFQPIVSLPAGEILAYEVLGRGTHEKLPSSPKKLFRVAEAVEREGELSRLFRKNERRSSATQESTCRPFSSTHIRRSSAHRSS